jgi:hypothetical protein
MRIIYCLSILLILLCGCVATTQISSQRGTIKLGMTKTEVLEIWGEPVDKFVLPAIGVYGQAEDWNYPHANWWGTNGVALTFDKDGKLIIIDPVYK